MGKKFLLTHQCSSSWGRTLDGKERTLVRQPEYSVILQHSVIFVGLPVFSRLRFGTKSGDAYRLVWGAIIALKGRLRSDGGGWMLRVVYGWYGNTKQQEAMAGCQGHIWGAFWHLRYLDHARTWYKQQQNMIIS